MLLEKIHQFYIKIENWYLSKIPGMKWKEKSRICKKYIDKFVVSETRFPEINKENNPYRKMCRRCVCEA